MSPHSAYRWCAVTNCKNTTLKTPDKLFIKVPNNIEIRSTWLELSGRDATKISEKTVLHLCEDHFDLQHDMENYAQFKIMGSVKRIKMRPNTIPSKFTRRANIPPSQLNSLLTAMEYPLTAKADTSSTPCESVLQLGIGADKVYGGDKLVHSSTSHESDLRVANICDDACKVDKEVQVHVVPAMEYKSVQTNLSSHFRSRATQIDVKMRNTTTSPIKTTISVGTSPHTAGQKPSISGVTRPIKRKLSTMFEEQSDSEVSFTPSVAGSTSQDFSPSKITTTSDSSLPEDLQKEDQRSYFNTLSKIQKKPKLYIGLSKELYFLINIIQRHSNISEQNILLCLTKIRLNSSFSQLSDDFGLSLSQASKIFSTNILPISKLLSSFIKKIDRETIKLNLPIAFRHRYHMVSCIIDCLEIEIQKPSNAVHQALTWSDYKKANTMKYLVACTPDGMISYVSAGYGGRISDVTLVENSHFLDSLTPGACILADRGFKHIEAYLTQRNFTLIRPPSVIGGAKLSKAEVRQTKQIASLRITVERVIRRIREFAMLKPHSVVNINLVSVLDECIVTACALINLQDSLTK